MAAFTPRASDSRYNHWVRLVREAGWQECAEGSVRVELLALTEAEIGGETGNRSPGLKRNSRTAETIDTGNIDTATSQPD